MICTNFNFSHFLPELFDLIEEGEEASVQFYKDWVKDVKEHVPKEKLLVFDVKSGH